MNLKKYAVIKNAKMPPILWQTGFNVLGEKKRGYARTQICPAGRFQNTVTAETFEKRP